MSKVAFKGLSGFPYHTTFSATILQILTDREISFTERQTSWQDGAGNGGTALIIDTDEQIVFLLFLKYPELVFRMEDLNKPIGNVKRYANSCDDIMNRKLPVTL